MQPKYQISTPSNLPEKKHFYRSLLTTKRKKRKAKETGARKKKKMGLRQGLTSKMKGAKGERLKSRRKPPGRVCSASFGFEEREWKFEIPSVQYWTKNEILAFKNELFFGCLLVVLYFWHWILSFISFHLLGQQRGRKKGRKMERGGGCDKNHEDK